MFSFLFQLFTRKHKNEFDPETITEELWSCPFKNKEAARFISEQGASYTAEVQHKGLCLTLLKENVYAWCVNPIFRYKDLILEGEIVFPESLQTGEKDQKKGRAGRYAAGFLFRYLSETTFYSVLISDSGLIRMDAVLNGNPLPVLAWTETATVNKNQYHLRIIARGTGFSLLVDNKWVAECSDDSIQAAGKIAYAGQNWALTPKAVSTLASFRIDSRPLEVEAAHTRWNRVLPIPSESRINLAKTWYAMGKYVPAILELKKAWQNRDPGTEDLLLSSQIYLAQRLFPEAEAEARKALRLQGDHIEVASELGGILYLQNRFIELEELLSSLPDQAIASSPFLSNLNGHLQHWKGNHEAAALAYAQAGELNTNQGIFHLNEGKEWELAGNTNRALDAYFEAGSIFLEEQDNESLEEIISILLKLAGENPKTAAIAGKYYYGIEEYTKAKTFLKKAALSETEDSAVWYLYGMLLSSEKKTHKALDCLKKAVALAENYGPYRFRLAETLFFEGQDCSQEIEAALRTAGDNAWVYNLAALHSLKENKLQDAEVFIHKARELLPDERVIRINEAEIYRRQGKLNDILSGLDNDDVDLLKAGAQLLIEDGRLEEAEEWFIKAVRLKPYDAQLLTDRATNCLELDLLNEADDLLSRALELDPQPKIYRLIGHLARRKGEYARAEIALQTGSTAFPQDKELLFELATFYLSNNKTQKAAAILPRIKELDSSERSRALEEDILNAGTVRVSCGTCALSWRVPKDAPPQGTLHLVAEPPDNLPAGTCPDCGLIYCIGCAKTHLDADGRFRCGTCGVPLKLSDNNVKWLLNQWQESAETESEG